MDPMVMSKYVHGVMIMIGGLSLLFAVFTILYLICGFLPLWLKRLRKEPQREQHQFPIDVEAGNPRSVPIFPPPRPAPPYQPPSVTHPPQSCSPPAPLQVPQANRVSIPDPDVLGKPPSYEEALLMSAPPPSYSEVLADSRGGGRRKYGVLGPTFTFEICNLPVSAPGGRPLQVTSTMTSIPRREHRNHHHSTR
ncbi:proline-rich protein 7 [Takifugu rubripes]|uniref:proline-rich protein 7 n=1 Tax=Takifugu rubripes TaxID=31033 RepID=UPI0011456923|nr:proline-rich protein 7 [Takifugu rubripes]